MLAPQIFVIALFLSIIWGIYVLATAQMYLRLRVVPHTSKEMVAAIRRFVVAWCAWLFVFSFVFRTGSALVGMDDEISTQIVFYALLGSNVVGSIYAVISLWYD